VNIHALLAQDQVWQPKDPIDGKPVIALPDMLPSHRRNLYAFLHRRADLLKFKHELAMVSGPGPSGDMACDAFDHEMTALFDIPPRVWLDGQPLMRRLRELITADRRAALRTAAGTVPAGALAGLRTRDATRTR
jgi:hypothetical protein